MHVISKKPLREFSERYSDAESPLNAWHNLAEHSDWEKFSDIKETHPQADKVGKFIVFNIGGNKYRLIVVVHFNTGKVFVRHVLTHQEYDEGAWKQE